jgi:CRP/FNR family transcriptional regulator, cyclic AMP receptor protein
MNNEEITNALSAFDLFRELDDREIEKIVSVSLSREWIKGSLVFMQGEPMENVYFIHEGKIKIYKTDTHGKEQIVAILKKGDMFPHVGFFRKGEYPAFAEVMEKSTLVVVPISGFENVLIENPNLCIKVFKILGEKIVNLQNRLEELILNNTYEQIIKLLIRLAEEHGVELGNGSLLLKADFTNKDLAKMIGTTRETVSRTLTKMKKENLIEVDENGDIIITPDRLIEEIL